MNLRFSPKLFITLVVICRIYSVQTNEKVPCSATKGSDCSHILEKNPFSSSGTYRIKPKCSTKSFQVYCDMDMNTGIGWTVIQRHNGQDSLSFSRTWDEYKQGFGSLTGEHWLGLDNIHTLTRQDLKVVRLLVCLEDYSDNKATALYSKFKIEDETHNYKIKLGKYEGTAGDGFRGRDEDTNEDGSYFSTWDRDNDDCPKLDIDRMCMRGDIAFFSCSQSITHSGWWFKRCGIADLNGIWQEKGNHTGWLSGIHWETWKRSESLKSSEMKLHIF